MELKDIRVLADNVRERIQKVIVGKSDTVELMLCAMIARGHVLLEDVPGTGKTVMAKSLAKSLDCAFSRIQFTPDLLPSDVTGLSIFNARTENFEFKSGPVFTNILLADEINRATPRTQSALLECMEERQVTESGVTRALDEPFLVVATQNPVETQGTFPLPEAQLDRFLMKLRPGYPNTDEALAILDRFISSNPLETLTPCAAAADIRAAQGLIGTVHVSEPVRRYMVALVEKTRDLPEVQTGVSPRGLLALLRACQSWAAMHGRDFVTPDDVKALSVPVLAHRIILGGLYGRSTKSEEVVREALSQIAAPVESGEGA